MIEQEPPPGSVITWCLRFKPSGPDYQYVAFRVAGRGWFTSSTKLNRALMWTKVRQLIGDSPAYVATAWTPLIHADLPPVPAGPPPATPGDDIGACDYPGEDCPICQHTACGWCPECSAGVPEWTI